MSRFECRACGWVSIPPESAGIAVLYHPCRPVGRRRRLVRIPEPKTSPEEIRSDFYHALVEETGAAVVGIGHLNKAPGSDVLHRLGGSVGFGAAARSVLLFVDDPDDDDSPDRLLAHGKCNVGPHASTLRFKVEGRTVTTDDGEIATSGLAWLGDDRRGAGELLTTRDHGHDRSERDLAADIITDALSSDPRPWAELAELIADEGVSEMTGRRARDTLKSEGVIESYKDGRGPWRWKLLTPPDQVEAEQVPKPPSTRNNVQPSTDVAQSSDTEQVTPSADHLARAQQLLETAEMIPPKAAS